MNNNIKKTTSPQGTNIRFKSNKTHLSSEESFAIDYKDPKKLKRIISARGRKMAGRLTGLNAKNQRQVSNSIDRARYLALLPYVSLEG